MKRVFIILLSIFLLIGCTPKSDKVKRSETVAINATDYFVMRNDDAFYLLLSANMKNSMAKNELTEELNSITRIYGKVLEISNELPKSIARDNYTIVKVPVRYVSGWMDFEYRINNDGSIEEFKITASKMLDESGYNETKDTYEVDGVEYDYILTKPNTINENTRICILMHDKDYYDRNSSIGVNKLFRALAYNLADNGVISIRYDRSVLNSEVKDNEEVLLEEIKALVEVIKDNDELKDLKLYLFGYGIGGYMLPFVASQDLADGYIIMNAPSKNISDYLKKDQDYLIDLDESLSEEVKTQKHNQVDATYQIIDNLTSDNDYDYNLFGYSSRYWMFLKEYEPIMILNNIDDPVLIVGGSNDYKVSQEYFNDWKHHFKDKANVEFKFYKDFDHFMSIKTTPSSIKDIMKEIVISKSMVKDVVNFMMNH